MLINEFENEEISWVNIIPKYQLEENPFKLLLINNSMHIIFKDDEGNYNLYENKFLKPIVYGKGIITDYIINEIG